jgi:tetratricopeptide (TPR) repeat protein
VRNDDAQTAAKKLDVASILTGSVRQSPSTIRISAELIDGRTGLDKWTQDYDRSPGDAIKIQTDIAENVATALSAALGGAVRSTISIGGTDNAQAQRLFIQAGALAFGQTTKPALEQSIKLIDAAIAADPNYADAYARKSQILIRYGNNYAASADELARNRSDALRQAQLALHIAPNLAQGHRALYGVYSSSLQMAPALAELNDARKLAPGDPEIRASYGSVLCNLGRYGQGLPLIDQAIAADPLNPANYSVRLLAMYFARRYGEAVAYAERLQSNSPNLFNDPETVAYCLTMLGRIPEAQSYFARSPADYWARITGEAVIAARQGDRAGAQAKLERLQAIYGDAASTQFGEVYAQLGDKDSALAALEKAYQVKDAGLTTLLVDPLVDPVRREPRFAAIVRKMDFPA